MRKAPFGGRMSAVIPIRFLLEHSRIPLRIGTMSYSILSIVIRLDILTIMLPALLRCFLRERPRKTWFLAAGIGMPNSAEKTIRQFPIRQRAILNTGLRCMTVTR